MPRQAALVCGILAPLLYAAMNVFVPMQWPCYDAAAQTVSELSAIGAPTRALWLSLGIPYCVLVAVFGYGVWTSARRSIPLRVVGAVMIAHAVISLAWPPMHLREVLAAGGATLTDTLHIVCSMVTVLLMLVAIGCGAAAFGRRFRRYSIATIVILVACGALTGLDAPLVQANRPTPWIGIWERIDIGAFLLWMVVLATTLLRRVRETAASGQPVDLVGRSAA
jgi:uncharacterized protein DUF998